MIVFNHYIRYFGTFSTFWDSYKCKNMDKITQILENVVRCKYFEAGVHIKNPIKNSYQDGLGRTTQTLNHVVVVHILIWDKRKSQINEYSDLCESQLLTWREKFICRSNRVELEVHLIRTRVSNLSPKPRGLFQSTLALQQSLVP